MYYKIVVIIIAIAVMGLGCRFIFSSDSILKEWGLQSIDSTQVLGRRLGAIYFWAYCFIIIILNKYVQITNNNNWSIFHFRIFGNFWHVRFNSWAS